MYNALKTDIATFLGISKDALHIHLGLFLFVGLVLLLRRSPAHPLPWLLVLGFEVLNELMDIFHWHAGSWSFEIGDSGKDLIGTMLWPTILLLLARLSASWRGKYDGPRPTVTGEPGESRPTT
jgi:hypothetical protein